MEGGFVWWGRGIERGRGGGGSGKDGEDGVVVVLFGGGEGDMRGWDGEMGVSGWLQHCRWNCRHDEVHR